MKSSTVFVIPFNLPWDWSADYQKQTCLQLAKNYSVVAYMQRDAIFFLKALLSNKPVYPSYKNVRFYCPVYFLPFRRIRCIERANQLLSFLMFEIVHVLRKDRVLWIFDPEFYLLARISRCMTIYDCVDYVSDKNASASLLLHKEEKQLIQEVDYFFVNSLTLAGLHSSLRKDKVVVPQGFRLDDFCNPASTQTRFSKNKPIVGFVGAINHRIDYELLAALIQNNPQWQFVLWGLIQETEDQERIITQNKIRAIRRYKNILMGSSLNRREIPNVISQFDIAIIPYNTRLEATRFSFPMKIFEYFYIGKPVLSSPIEELKRFPKFIKLGDSVEEWERNIGVFLSKPWPESYKREQRRLAIENSWENKVNTIISMLDARA